MIAVFDGPISRRDDVIDSQWDSRIRRILETVPDPWGVFIFVRRNSHELVAFRG